MVDVLLTHSNHLFRDSKQVEKMQPYPPLQTLFAAAVLRQAGHSVALCDVTLNSPLEALESALETYRPRLVVVCEDDFNFLSKMCLSRNRALAFEIAKSARRRSIPVGAHSSDATDHAQAYLEAGFDYVLIGEVEATLLELASGRRPGDIAGLAFASDNSTPRYTKARALRQNLDSLPLPARDLVDIESYRQAWLSAHGYFSLNMVTSRGCPYQCNWCSKPIWGDSYHARSARMIAEEMLSVKLLYRPDHIWFADDIFALSHKWTSEFAHAVDALNARVPFKMQSRCDLMTRDAVSALRQAGCAEVWMGAESGSQQVLSAMDKRLRVEDIYSARANLRRHGIRACFFVQFGYPGETWDDIEATVRMLRETEPDDVGISVSYPLPGTKFHRLVANQMRQKANWTDSGDLAMMFQGAYSSDFYRALAVALHLEVRQPKDRESIQNAWILVHTLRGADAQVKMAS